MTSKALRMDMMLVDKAVGCQPTEVTNVDSVDSGTGYCRANTMTSKALIMHMMLVYKAVGCQSTEVTNVDSDSRHCRLPT